MKTLIKLLLQRLLGFRTYLYVFSRFVIFKLQWDKKEKDFLYFLNLLPEKGTVLDIGANLGVMSYYLAKAYTRRRVYAFEPVPCNFANLERIRQKFDLKNLFTFQTALGEKDGELEMVLPVQKSVRFHGLAHVRHSSMGQDKGEIYRCEVKKLDTFDPLLNDTSPITGIKIDVENYEYYVLKGAEKIIRQHKPVIYSELWDNENRRNTLDFLQKLNYRTMVLSGDKLVSFDPAVHTTQNFFFIPGNDE